SLWRIHFSFKVPSFACDFLEITATKGKNTGETLSRFPIEENDYIIADRAYSTPNGISHIHKHKGYSLIRVNSTSLPLYNKDKSRFQLLKAIKKIKQVGPVDSWNVYVKDNNNDDLILGRICVIKKSKEATELAQRNIIKEATKKHINIKAETLEFAKYIIVFTTFPKDEFTCKEIL
ncbi:MAG: IS4 family transposase, partial [Oligoflexia bacterium]|nr:IS4 family transposase [Oligoflexia bacterium]